MKGRFAPSPTGLMHLGNARTALLAWLQVRSAGGKILLRIEDLDTQRVLPGAEEAILADLSWLGLDWDGDSIRQSDHRARHTAAIARLLAQGQAFECACSRAEIAAAASAPQGDDGAGQRYPGTCRDLPGGEAAARAAGMGRKTAVRFRGQGITIAFQDEVAGPVEGILDDFVIQRADGIAAYQLAVVADDAAAGISHVLRADDLLDSTPKQIALYRALGLAAPSFAHVPLVLASGGERLAKRNRPASVKELRDSGVSREELVGALAASAGLVPDKTAIQARDLVAGFTLGRVRRSPVVMDLPLREAPIVRRVTGSDVIPLAEVYIASWQAAYRGLVPDPILDALNTATQTARWQKILASSARSETRPWLIEESGRVRGFLITGPVRGEERAGAAEIWAMYLDPAVWRRGLGRRLLRRVESELKGEGIGELLLWVLAGNARGLAFFQANGFLPAGASKTERMGSALLEEVRLRKNW